MVVVAVVLVVGPRLVVVVIVVVQYFLQSAYFELLYSLKTITAALLLFFGPTPQKVLLLLRLETKDCSPVVDFGPPLKNNTSKTLEADQPRLQWNKSNKSTYLQYQHSLKLQPYP